MTVYCNTFFVTGRGFLVPFLFNKYQEKRKYTHTVRNNKILKGYENKYCITFLLIITKWYLEERFGLWSTSLLMRLKNKKIFNNLFKNM